MRAVGPAATPNASVPRLASGHPARLSLLTSHLNITSVSRGRHRARRLGRPQVSQAWPEGKGEGSLQRFRGGFCLRTACLWSLRSFPSRCSRGRFREVGTAAALLQRPCYHPLGRATWRGRAVVIGRAVVMARRRSRCLQELQAALPSLVLLATVTTTVTTTVILMMVRSSGMTRTGTTAQPRLCLRRLFVTVPWNER